MCVRLLSYLIIHYLTFYFAVLFGNQKGNAKTHWLHLTHTHTRAGKQQERRRQQHTYIHIRFMLVVACSLYHFGTNCCCFASYNCLSLQFWAAAVWGKRSELRARTLSLQLPLARSFTCCCLEKGKKLRRSRKWHALAMGHTHISHSCSALVLSLLSLLLLLLSTQFLNVFNCLAIKTIINILSSLLLTHICPSLALHLTSFCDSVNACRPSAAQVRWQ